MNIDNLMQTALKAHNEIPNANWYHDGLGNINIPNDGTVLSVRLGYSPDIWDFIVKFNPSTVLSILDKLQEYENKINEYESKTSNVDSKITVWLTERGKWNFRSGRITGCGYSNLDQIEQLAQKICENDDGTLIMEIVPYEPVEPEE